MVKRLTNFRARLILEMLKHNFPSVHGPDFDEETDRISYRICGFKKKFSEVPHVTIEFDHRLMGGRLDDVLGHWTLCAIERAKEILTKQT